MSVPSLCLPPEDVASDLCALTHSLELGPDNPRFNFRLVHCLGGEATIGTGNDILPANPLGEAYNSLGNVFGMLDNAACVRYNPGNEEFSFL